MATKRKEQTEKVRNDILGGARACFVNFGFFGASISMIAKSAGVSQGLIYHYFRDKVHLWKEVKKDALEAAHIRPDFGAQQAKTFREFLEIVVHERFRFYRDNPDIRALISWEKLQSNGTSLLGIKEHFKGIWIKELTMLQTIGEIPKDIDTVLLSALTLSAIEGVFDYVPIFSEKSKAMQKQEQYLSMVIDTLHRAFRVCK